MARIPFTRTLIEVPVADRRIGDTLIKQKFRFTTLTHEQNLDGVCRVAINGVVTMYASEGGEYGPALTAAGFTARPVTMAADNQTLVDAATGAILAIQQDESAAEWAARINSFPQDTMLQGDFFEYLREHADVRIGDLIRQHIAQADALGRFA